MPYHGKRCSCCAASPTTTGNRDRTTPLGTASAACSWWTRRTEAAQTIYTGARLVATRVADACWARRRRESRATTRALSDGSHPLIPPTNPVPPNRQPPGGTPLTPDGGLH